MGIDRANYEGKVFNRNIGKKLNFKKIKHVNEMTQQKRVCKKAKCKNILDTINTYKETLWKSNSLSRTH